MEPPYTKHALAQYRGVCPSDKGREVRIQGRMSGGRPRGKVKISGRPEAAHIGVRTPVLNQTPGGDSQQQP
jgi:hypothetical protein